MRCHKRICHCFLLPGAVHLVRTEHLFAHVEQREERLVLMIQLQASTYHPRARPHGAKVRYSDHIGARGERSWRGLESFVAPKLKDSQLNCAIARQVRD